jgi:hypothetical protein
MDYTREQKRIEGDKYQEQRSQYYKELYELTGLKMYERLI